MRTKEERKKAEELFWKETADVVGKPVEELLSEEKPEEEPEE